MGNGMRRTVFVGITLLLACCASDPAVVGDRASPQFKADLRGCRHTSDDQVTRDNSKSFPGWLASPFTSPGKMRRAMLACMEGKGYAAR